MAVLPINSVSVNANQYTFTGRKDKDSHKTNPLAGLPVVVMLAMAPMAEGKQPAQFVPIDSAHLTELVAQASATNLQTAASIQAELDNALKNNKSIQADRILLKSKGKFGGEDAYFLLTSMDKNDTHNRVENIQIVTRGLKPKDHPPSVTELVYHDLGAGKEFCSVKVNETFFSNDGKTRLVTYETRIDDQSAQLIIDLMANEMKWKNGTRIKFSETKSDELAAFKVIYKEM